MSSENPIMDTAWIHEMLPHRYPLLLVDRVLEIEPGKRIRALKNVTVNEQFFIGHFPGHPVMPGVLILEAMAQAGGILVLHDRPDRDHELFYFTGVERARFRRPVVPGDQVIFEVELAAIRSRHCRLEARALVEGKVAAQATISSTMVPR